MWWYAPTAAFALVLFVVSWWIGRVRRGGPGDRILPPWLVAVCWCLVVGGIPLVLFRALPDPKAISLATLLSLSIGLATPISALLIALWSVARRRYGADRCGQCGHQLIQRQIACPECGDARRSSTVRTYGERLESLGRERPLLVGSVLAAQHALLLVAFVTAALLVVPTPRTVVSMLQSGSASRVITSTDTAGESRSSPFSWTYLINSRVKTSASFLLPAPLVPSDIALEFRLDGSISTQRETPTDRASVSDPDRQSAIESRPLLLTRDIRSLAGVNVLEEDVHALTAEFAIDSSQNPLNDLVAAVLMFAQDYWPTPAPSGPAPLPAMPAYDRSRAPWAIDPWHVTVGIPFIVGVLCALIAHVAARRAVCTRERTGACR